MRLSGVDPRFAQPTPTSTSILLSRQVSLLIHNVQPLFNGVYLPSLYTCLSSSKPPRICITVQCSDARMRSILHTMSMNVVKASSSLDLLNNSHCIMENDTVRTSSSRAPMIIYPRHELHSRVTRRPRRWLWVQATMQIYEALRPIQVI